MNIQNMSRSMAVALALPLALATVPASIAVSAGAQDATDPGMAYSIARGGRLYDKWFKVVGTDGPEETHSLWPASNTNKDGDTTWRCKSCHGWDLMGKDGAYASGSYKTGIIGLQAYDGGSPEEVIAIMKADAHGYDGMMREQDFVDLANFVTKSQIDEKSVIDYDTKASDGDKAQGKEVYQTVCANCHGLDGMEPSDMPALGALSNGNPQETLHKIRFGQPDENMPALHALGIQASLDVLSFLQELPEG